MSEVTKRNLRASNSSTQGEPTDQAGKAAVLASCVPSNSQGPVSLPVVTILAGKD